MAVYVIRFSENIFAQHVHSKLCDLCVSQQIFQKQYKAIPELFWVFLRFYLSVWNVLINLWCYQTPKNSSIAVFLPSFLARWVLGGAGHYVRFKKPFIECIISSWSSPSGLEISYWFFCFFREMFSALGVKQLNTSLCRFCIIKLEWVTVCDNCYSLCITELMQLFFYMNMYLTFSAPGVKYDAVRCSFFLWLVGGDGRVGGVHGSLVEIKLP